MSKARNHFGEEQKRLQDLLSKLEAQLQEERQLNLSKQQQILSEAAAL